MYKLFTEPNLMSNLWKVHQSVESGSALLGQKMQTPKIQDCPCIAGAPENTLAYKVSMLLVRRYILTFFSHYLRLFYFDLRNSKASWEGLYCHTSFAFCLFLITWPDQLSSVAQSCPTLWPHAAACQASLSITNSRSSLKLMSIESVMPSNHLILCRPLLVQPSIFLSIRVFSHESVLCIRRPKYWSFSFSISPSNE